MDFQDSGVYARGTISVTLVIERPHEPETGNYYLDRKTGVLWPCEIDENCSKKSVSSVKNDK